MNICTTNWVVTFRDMTGVKHTATVVTVDGYGKDRPAAVTFAELLARQGYTVHSTLSWGTARIAYGTVLDYEPGLADWERALLATENNVVVDHRADEITSHASDETVSTYRVEGIDGDGVKAGQNYAGYASIEAAEEDARDNFARWGLTFVSIKTLDDAQ